MHVFEGLRDASDANDTETCITSITKCSGERLTFIAPVAELKSMTTGA